MMKYVIKTMCFLLVVVSLTSCFKRELNDDENYTNLKRAESIKDNEILRFRTFRIDKSNNFLIFGNNNEVSIDGIAQLPLYFFIENGNKQATIDLTGCIYEYDKKTDEIVFRKAMVRSKHLKKPLIFDVTCKFSKVSEKNTKSEIFTLQFKKLAINDKTLSVGDKIEINGQKIGFISEFKYKLVYYRS